MKKCVNIAFIGHIDHGKSTLIGRMLYEAGAIKEEKIEEVRMVAKQLKKDFEFAFVIDNLEEEREGGLTIDTIQLGFESKKQAYNIIDCPGHLEFIKNMLTGTSNADAAILLLSAQENERIQDQTKRHLFLANLFGVKQLFVAVNKMDVVNYDKKVFESLKSDLTKYLASINFSAKDVMFFPVSAKIGDNVWNRSANTKWYSGPTLIEALDKFTKPLVSQSEMPLRLVVQDVYNFGKTPIIVGRVESGTINKGDDVFFDPAGIKTKVKSIEMFNEKKEKAIAGECIGLILTSDGAAIKRGDVCSHPDSRSNVSKKIKSKIFLLSNTSISTSDTLSITCGTTDVKCRASSITSMDSRTGEVLEKNGKVVMAGNAAELFFETEKPAVFERFSEIPPLGRFVVSKNGSVAAVGVVINY